MTDEQIKKNAFEYSLQNCCVYDDNGANDMDSIREAYLDGAQSRDEEIRELLEKYTYKIDSLIAQKEDLQQELNKLRSPWISVEDRLPEKTRNLSPFPDEYDEKVVLVINKQGGKRLAYKDYKWVWRDDYTCEIVNQNYARITHWMPIPEVKKGE